jgi:transposase
VARYKKEIRKYAQELFVQSSLNAKEIAERLNIDEKTIGRWRAEEDWDNVKTSFTMSKSNQLRNFYAQITEINTLISERPLGTRFATNKESDTLIKLTTSIKNLETETSLTDIIDVSIQMTTWLKAVDPEKAKEITLLFDKFIKSIA